MHLLRDRATLLGIPLFLGGLLFSGYQYTSVGDLPEDRLARDIEVILDRIADAPGNVSLRQQLARFYEQQGQLREAIATIRAALSQRGLSRRARYNLYIELSRLLLKAGDPQRAYRAASLARKLLPTKAVAYNRRGQSHEARGSTRQALVEYRRAERVDPNHPESYYRRAMLEEKKGNFAKAEELLREAVRRAPRSARALVDLAEFLIRHGKTEEGLKLLQRAVALAPKNAQVRLAYGRALQGNGQHDAALEQFRTAVRLNKRLAQANELAGDILFERKEYPGALTHYRNALRYDRNNQNLVRKFRRTRRLIQAERARGNEEQNPGKGQATGKRKGGATSGGRNQNGPGGNGLQNPDKGLGPGDGSGRNNESGELARLKAEGRRQYLAGNYEQARGLFLRAAQIAPKDDDSHYLLGRTYAKLGSRAQALSSLEQSLALNNNNGRAAFHLGLMQVGEKNFARAATLFRQTQKNSEALRDQARFNEARSLELAGKQSAAIGIYRGLSGHPKLGASAARNLALLYRKMGQDKRALRAIDAGLKQFPGRADLHFQKGVLAQAQNDIRTAEESYRKATQVDAGYFQAWFNYGLLLSRSGRTGPASDAFEQAVKLRPKEAGAHYELGRNQLALGKQSTAIKHLRRTLELESGHAGASLLLAGALAAAGEKTEVFRVLESGREKHPRHFRLLFNGGNTLRQIGNHAAARQFYRGALRAKPQKPEAYMNLALSYRDTSEWQKAARVYNALIQRLPNHAPAHEQLGLLYYQRLSNPGAGARHIRRFLQLQPRAKNAGELRKLLGER